MKIPLTITLLLLFTALFAQRATTVQPEYFSAFRLAERLPGGELVTVHQSGKNSFLSYSTLTVTTSTGDTLWSITEDSGNGGEVLNIFPLSDTSFLTHGYIHECDISYGMVKIYHTSTGEPVYDTDALNFYENYVSSTEAGVRLSGGDFILLGKNVTALYSSDFSTIYRTSLEEEFHLCGNIFRSAVAGPNNNVLVIHESNWPPDECPPHLREIRVVALDSSNTEIQVTQPIIDLPGRALDIMQVDTFTYILSDQRLVKANRDFQSLAYRELTSNATDAIIGFANDELFVLHFANNQYEMTRYALSDLEPIDTISLDYVPGLTYNDFYVSGDSIYAYGELNGYPDEVSYGQYTDATTVRTVTPLGLSMTLPVTDLQLETLTGGEVTIQPLGIMCGETCRNNSYSATYSGLRVRMTNTGETPITDFYLHTQTRSKCDCFSLCGLSEFWRHRFTGLSIAPGEEVTLALNDIFIGDQLDDYQLCLWAANVNGGLDVDHTNNVACYDLVNATSESFSSERFEMYPDRNAGLLSLRTTRSDHFKARVYDLSGRLVGAAAGAGEVVISMPPPRGVYLVTVMDGNGLSQTRKLVW